MPVDPSGNGKPLPPGAPKNAYAPETCTTQSFGEISSCAMHMVCQHSCTTARDCPPGGSGSATITCVELGFPTGVCVLGCGNGAVCPDGMQCLITGRPEVGTACYWSEPNVQRGCPGWCAALREGCARGAADDCCDGTVCAPWGSCETGDCLQLSWPCEAGGPPCCGGTACIDGYCKPS